jgi:predicted ATPase/class 3 adenylate cyclase
MALANGLPSGIVTFVFTDIEGSTRHLRRLGARYSTLLDRHLELMQAAWDAHGGVVVDTAGDGVFVAFQQADAAVNACAEAQRRLSSEPWPADGVLRSRMGVHTGLAAPTGHDYRALAVHQAARVMSSAHGGQVLLSSATVDRLSRLDGTTVVPLGRFRVRDFDEPVRLFQLAGDGLAAELPAVRALPADGTNLVAPTTSFRGRDEVVADVHARLGPGRLVTLAGPGGVGKTRLATQVGLDASADWPDGAWFVELGAIEAEDALIAPVVAAALGVPGRGDDRWSEVLDHLAERQALLIMDNCEGVAPACARMLDELLARCPACGVLATSRVPLGGAREDVARLSPLPVDGADGEPGAAVALFLDRVAPDRRAAAADPMALPIVTEICRRLDGLPLALELAAARLAVISPHELLDGLTDRFRVLRSHDPTVPERQRTLEALLDWSDRLLTPGERTCLRRIGVFGGSFSVAAATAAVAADPVDPYDVPELLWSLADKSLVTPDLTSSATRYRLLESVQEFARRRLHDDEGVASTAVRLATWYLERVGPAHRFEPTWQGEVSVEIDNLRALVDLLADIEPSMAQELSFTIARFNDGIDAYREGIAELQRDIARLSATTPAAVSLRTTMADLLLRLGDATEAKLALADAEALLHEVGSLPPWDDVAVERTRGDLACRSGDYVTAVEGAQQALRGDLSDAGRARMCNQLGIAALALGDLDGAAAAFEQELEACRHLGDLDWQSIAHSNLAEVELRRDRHAAAAGHQRECLTLAFELGTRAMVAFSLIVAARLEALAEGWEHATMLHAQAESIIDELGLVLYEDDQRESDVMLEQAHHALGDAHYAAARHAGRTMEVPRAGTMADHILARVAAG